MYQNFLKLALRNLQRQKAHSIINIAGLAVGMAVAILIGLWIWNELTYDKDNGQHDRIALVKQNVNINGEIGTWTAVPFPLGEELRRNYGSDFKYVVMASWPDKHIITYNNKSFNKTGAYFEADGPELLDLKMLRGTRDGLKNPGSILLSESVAKTYFGNDDPLNKIIKLDNQDVLKVTGVYEDFPYNSSFSDIGFLAPWELVIINWGLNKSDNPWRSNSFLTYVQLIDRANIQKASIRIRDAKLKKVREDEKKHHAQLFLHPMDKWHLYGDFMNGVNVGGRIQYVWMFGIIGLFVLLLACINFMNLSTARSEKKARETGIRKAIGSRRWQLILQYFTESVLVASFAWILSVLLVRLVLPAFNTVADKKMTMPWDHPLFWALGGGFAILCGLLAGIYPALFLSSFQPVKVLKGTYKAGRMASIPRKALVVVQFTVSVVLIIGTIVVFRQIQFARDRSLGYDNKGLIMLPMANREIHKHFEAVKQELVNSGIISSMAESEAPITSVWSTNSGFEWKGKDPGLAVDFPNSEVSYNYAETVGWQFMQGRSFSKDFAGDSSAFVINEAAAKYMGLKNPVGEIVRWDGRPYTVIGVIKDIIIESPFDPVRPSFFHLSTEGGNIVAARVKPGIGLMDALSKIEKVFKKFNPSQPFDYMFADSEYNKKFGNEQRTGMLAGFFSMLAIFISCLGLFGIASFVSEQRTKEIGIRKVLGASVLGLWRLLTREFIGLVIISLLIAGPIAYYFMAGWLQQYQYRTEISWWIFGIAALGALLITLITVSAQAIKAAIANPVKSLRTE